MDESRMEVERAIHRIPSIYLSKYVKTPGYQAITPSTQALQIKL
ncbi:hypothetical protein [Rossellomorea marisflavi]